MAMQSIGQLVHHATQPQSEHDQQASSTVRKLFLILQGTYGTQFLSKFSTGMLDNSTPPRDKGVMTAMRVWDRALSKYTGEVIEEAANRVAEAHKQFPPNLAEFEALCRAAAPSGSQVWLTPERCERLLALPKPKMERLDIAIEPVGDGKDGYRKIWREWRSSRLYATVKRGRAWDAEKAIALTESAATTSPSLLPSAEQQAAVAVLTPFLHGAGRAAFPANEEPGSSPPRHGSDSSR